MKITDKIAVTITLFAFITMDSTKVRTSELNLE